MLAGAGTVGRRPVFCYSQDPGFMGGSLGETHAETNPYLWRVWHRTGRQPTVPAAGTNRRLTVFGS